MLVFSIVSWLVGSTVRRGVAYRTESVHRGIQGGGYFEPVGRAFAWWRDPRYMFGCAVNWMSGIRDASCMRPDVSTLDWYVNGSRGVHSARDEGLARRHTPPRVTALGSMGRNHPVSDPIPGPDDPNRREPLLTKPRIGLRIITACRNIAGRRWPLARAPRSRSRRNIRMAVAACRCTTPAFDCDPPPGTLPHALSFFWGFHLHPPPMTTIMPTLTSRATTLTALRLGSLAAVDLRNSPVSLDLPLVDTTTTSPLSSTITLFAIISVTVTVTVSGVLDGTCDTGLLDLRSSRALPLVVVTLMGRTTSVW